MHGDCTKAYNHSKSNNHRKSNNHSKSNNHIQIVKGWVISPLAYEPSAAEDSKGIRRKQATGGGVCHCKQTVNKWVNNKHVGKQ